MDRDRYKFDLVTQRFLEGRWETALGKTVQEKVLAGLQNSVEVRAILDPYVLDHPENAEPYGFPYYPKSAMEADAFWVLTNDDLRGIHFYNENFEGSRSFEKKQFTYSSFYNCNLAGVEFFMSDLSYARLEKSNLTGVVFANSGGFSTKFLNCSAKHSVMWNCGFRDCDFSGTDFSGC